MRLLSLTLAAVAALAATAATAGERAKPQLFVCEKPTPARHVVHHEHGRLSFVSAERLLTEQAQSAKPRCITAAELTRYRELAAQRTQTIASR